MLDMHVFDHPAGYADDAFTPGVLPGGDHRAGILH
jgi:hypothetical protein